MNKEWIAAKEAEYTAIAQTERAEIVAKINSSELLTDEDKKTLVTILDEKCGDVYRMFKTSAILGLFKNHEKADDKFIMDFMDIEKGKRKTGRAYRRKMRRKLNHRNHKKDDNHLNKHAMHLIRLYLICLDILEKGDIVTYRGDDLGLLMSIRRGEYQKEDGTYRQEFFDMVNEFETRMAYAKENTALPENPDMKRVEEFVMEVNRRSLDG